MCGTPVVQDEGAVRVYCPNPVCPARVSQELSHFVGRGGMDIEGAAVLRELAEASDSSDLLGGNNQMFVLGPDPEFYAPTEILLLGQIG